MERQLQMSLNGVSIRYPRHRSRQRRIQWWFTQMRAAVDRAVDWPAPSTAKRPDLSETHSRHE